MSRGSRDVGSPKCVTEHRLARAGFSLISYTALRGKGLFKLNSPFCVFKNKTFGKSPKFYKEKTQNSRSNYRYQKPKDSEQKQEKDIQCNKRLFCF
jgi:hypothetical protein